ncbi:hypothetical protein A33Q_3752 [Indibacter alkaliphilus LW1]|uniref:Uncharacterized protein n=1 Tax=Indibacter alkaliphilus (strain CCUG 57479 / KCTC 22604 / LW1) TaxID=1189612 RepID=S2DUM2_INDAL|nr:hypothetical protein A33Q_3752 [Indibacter alkaliphilus LW1]
MKSGYFQMIRFYTFSICLPRDAQFAETKKGVSDKKANVS